MRLLALESRRVVKLTERRTVQLSEQDYRLLDNSSTFRDLVEDGIVSLVRTRQAPYGARAAAYVGQAMLEDGTHLIIGEKLPGALRSLVMHSVPDDLRPVDAPSAVDETSPVMEILADRFCERLGTYLRDGQIKEYRVRTDISGSPRGRLDLGRTLRLQARGRVGLVAHQHGHLTADLAFNQLLALGLFAAEAIAGRANLSLLAKCRTYAPIFEDLSWYPTWRMSLPLRAAAYQSALGDARATGALRDALAYARAMVLHLGVWGSLGLDEIPTSYFVSLETLFESAVLSASEALYGDTWSIGKGAALGVSLFRDADGYVADPDIVARAGQHIVLVGDCKYKDLDGRPSHQDVYQLVAHCAALRCSNGLLVYPVSDVAEGPSLNSLGTTRSGTTVRWAHIRPGHLLQDLAHVLGDLRMSAAIPAPLHDALQETT